MKSPYHTAAELVASVQTLLTLPEVYLRVKNVVEDPDSCLSDLVNEITIDPAITARLLQLVNSAYFNMEGSIDNIRQAVNLLGMKSVHDLVLATTLTSTFVSAKVMHLDMHHFWVNSVRRAVYAHLLGKQTGMTDHERLFIGGLLCDLGHQVVHMQIPELARQANILSVKSGNPVEVEERRLIGFDYADIGGELMHLWRMPENIIEAIRYHLEPQRAERFPRDTAIVHMANLLTRLDENIIAVDDLQLSTSDSAWELTGLSLEEVLIVQEQAQGEIENTTGLLLGQVAAA